MLKIALVQPIVEIGKSLRIQKSPTGIQVVGAQLKKQGYNVKLFHDVVSKKLIKDILEFAPDHLGISTMTANFLAGKDLANQIKKKNKNIIITLGGWHVSGCANSYMNNYETWSLKEILNKESPFDFIVVGEGDLIYPELIKRLKSKKSFEDLKGLGYFKNNKIYVSKSDRVNNLDALEDPIWDNLDINKYRDLRSNELDLSIHVQRGCRFNCAYCSTPNLYSGLPKRLSVERTIKYIKYLVKKYSPDVITFTDEDFFSNLPWIEKLCDLLIKEKINNKVVFDTFGSIHDIIKASKIGLLKKMKLAGFNSYFVGIESLNKKTLTIYNRPLNREKPIKEYLDLVQEAINVSLDAGLVFLADYMVGAFWENEKDVCLGFKRLTKLKNIPYVYLPILTPMPGTLLWKYVVDNNLLLKTKNKLDWNNYNASSSSVKLNYDVVKLRNTLEQEFYTSKQYLKEMKINIKENKNKHNYYSGLFSKLEKDYPKNKKIKIVLKELNSM